MNTSESVSLDTLKSVLARTLLDRRAAFDHWEGRLASSALSTGTAVLALDIVLANGLRGPAALASCVTAGTSWLARHQNADGGWGDTDRSRSNISTTAIVWATLSRTGRGSPPVATVVDRAEAWLKDAAAGVAPDALRSAILRRYGKDRTFSAPILTVLALTGKLGTEVDSSWRSIPQLPFELAALPHGWFQHLKLPVVSYALPALIAIGQVRHSFAPSRNPVTRLLRERVRQRTHRVLREMQPESGGYLEATPLTSFVVMSLAGMGWESPVVEHGVRFLLDSMRDDGSWPIDTNLSTWVTTLSVSALAEAGELPQADVPGMRRWLLDQQSRREHPFTHAAPGAWAWTPLSGGVPDADDTAGAMLALRPLSEPDAETTAAAAAGARWLLGVQNRDGGIPTFCRGWGTLPFDRSTPEITAHALRAWSAWFSFFDKDLQTALQRASARAMDFLKTSQRADGSWVPLWFGNEHAPDEENPVYGTARVLTGLHAALANGHPSAHDCRRRAIDYLLQAQNSDGGWGGAAGAPSTVEETGVVLLAIGRAVDDQQSDVKAEDAVRRGASWLTTATAAGIHAAPIGLYFARLWYYEDLYPLIFALSGVRSCFLQECTLPETLPEVDTLAKNKI